MRKNYTKQEIEEIRLAFEGTHGHGLISKIVFSESEKEKISTVDPQKLSEFFSSSGGHGVARLISTMNTLSAIDLQEFGSHSIDFYGVTSGPFSFENAMSLVGIMIGNRKKNISPLEWLSYLAKGFHKLSEIQKAGFNDVCEDFAKMNEAVASGEGIHEITEEELSDL